MFSKSCEYGIRAAIYIAEQSCIPRNVGLGEVAKAIASPEAYTSKILQKLSKSDIVKSEKGPTGGFSIELHKLNALNLSEIVTAIDGDSIYKGCGLGLTMCNEEKPCPVHDQFKEVRDNLKKMLETTLIKELASGLTDGTTFLKR